MVDSKWVDAEGKARQVEYEEINCHPSFTEGVALLWEVWAQSSDEKVQQDKNHTKANHSSGTVEGSPHHLRWTL